MTALFWKRQARTWHWMSGAVCLLGMLMFALTGITLNHAGDLGGEPQVVEKSSVLAPESLSLLNAAAPLDGQQSEIPTDVAGQIQDEIGAKVGGRMGEWTDIDVYISLPRPGGDAWMSIDRETGDVLYESTNRGAIAYLNDLHKGRHTGPAWSLFLDAFAIACVVFCLTGLWLLQMHSAHRKATWPLTAIGLALPVILAVIFIHG